MSVAGVVEAKLADRDRGEIPLAWPDARPLIPGPEHPWTDDYSDVLSALVRRIVGYVSGIDSLYPEPPPAHATWSGPVLP